MVAEDHIEAKEGAKELKREQRIAEEAAAWRQQQHGGSNAERLMGLQQHREAGLTQCSVAA